jgi:hypothetical protein
MNKLFPHPTRKEMLRSHKNVSELVNELVMAIIAHHRGDKLLQEIYLAGVWHGSEIMRQSCGIELADTRLSAFAGGAS